MAFVGFLGFTPENREFDIIAVISAIAGARLISRYGLLFSCVLVSFSNFEAMKFYMKKVGEP